MAMAADDRLWSKLVENDRGCWIFTGGLHAAGYGQISVGLGAERRMMLAHRFACELVVGVILEGLTLDHLCRDRRCCNPAHLEAVTLRENILRGVSPSAWHARTTHCPQGHPYSGTNLRIRRSGWRACRTCERDHVRAQRANERTG